MKLDVRYVEKPWGRTQLPPIFRPPAGRRIGEIWFGDDDALPLLAKYLFTSEKLSVQVHPNDEEAEQRGLSRGKTECWYVLEAERGSSIGLGLRHQLTRDELRSAALDGSIMDAIDWRPVQAGDFLHVPAGTIHAIGSGIALLEFQQNSDATYRLYDYGRPRELHVDDAVAVARLSAYPDRLARRVNGADKTILIEEPEFTLVHSRSDCLQDRTRWILPLEGSVRCNGDVAGPGECLLLDAGARLEASNARMLIGAGA
jgi:mannose-6-phosphate isomerase